MIVFSFSDFLLMDGYTFSAELKKFTLHLSFWYLWKQVLKSCPEIYKFSKLK